MVSWGVMRALGFFLRKSLEPSNETEKRGPVESSAVLAFYTLFLFSFSISKDFVLAGAAIFLLGIFTFWLPGLRASRGLFIAVAAGYATLRLLKISGPYGSWPVDFFFAFAVAVFLLGRTKIRLPATRWSWRLSKAEIVSIFLINVPTVFVLSWYYQTHPEVADAWRIPKVPSTFVPALVLAIAAVNGLREEIFYRRLLLPLADRAFPVAFVLIFEAASFGFLHYEQGFPRGAIGVALTAAWSVAMTLQYRLFRSIALSWLTHSIADGIMFGLILASQH